MAASWRDSDDDAPARRGTGAQHPIGIAAGIGEQVRQPHHRGVQRRQRLQGGGGGRSGGEQGTAVMPANAGIHVCWQPTKTGYRIRGHDGGGLALIVRMIVASPQVGQGGQHVVAAW